MAIYITGDTHGDWLNRLNSHNFPDGRELTKEDYVVILGDFGLWKNDKQTKDELDWLNDKPWTTLFIDGNHENYDWLYTFPIKKWHGGMVHEIRESILHLDRGYVFDIDGASCFTFGGARSTDINDGILEPDDPLIKYWIYDPSKYFRVNHQSWWKEEMPNEQEFDRGRANLTKVNWKVDFIFTHEVNGIWNSTRYIDNHLDQLQLYLDEIRARTEYKAWYFGHHHIDEAFYWDRLIGVYHRISRIW